MVFIGIVFVSSIVSLHITIELSVMFPTYLPFLQSHVAGSQI